MTPLTIEELQQHVIQSGIKVEDVLSMAVLLNSHLQDQKNKDEDPTSEEEDVEDLDEEDECIAECSNTQSKKTRKRNRKKIFPESEYMQTKLYIEHDLSDRLDAYCEDLGMGSKSYFINKVLRRELDALDSFREDEMKRKKLKEEQSVLN